MGKEMKRHKKGARSSTPTVVGELEDERTRKELIGVIEAHAGAGTMRSLVAATGLGPGTLARMGREYPEVQAAIDRVRAEADDRVEEALYKRAVGYRYTKEKVEEEDGKPVKHVREEVEVAPDVGAAKHWLAIRQRDRWGAQREEQETEVSFRELLAQKIRDELPEVAYRDITDEESDT